MNIILALLALASTVASVLHEWNHLGKQYMYDDATWLMTDECQNHCEEQQMELPIFTNRTEWEETMRMAHNLSTNQKREQFWIGYSDIQTAFHFVDRYGNIMPELRWHPGEPNRKGDLQNCITSYWQNGIYGNNNVKCGHLRGYDDHHALCMCQKTHEPAESARGMSLRVLLAIVGAVVPAVAAYVICIRQKTKKKTESKA